MRYFELLKKNIITEAAAKLVRGMLVQTPDQFIKSKGSERPDEGLEEELAPGEQPIKFAPSFRAGYSAQMQEPESRPYAKVITPDEVAQLVHHKNSYVIYYEYKSSDDPNKIIEKRITTEPIYISQPKVQELATKANELIDKKYPYAADKTKKQKVYVVLTNHLEKLAVEEAIKTSPEVKYALDKGLPSSKLKAKQFTKTATKGKSPSVHKSSVPIVNEDGQIIYDLDGLAARIMQRPEKLLKVNAKMEKSKGDFIRMANIGIPAIAGLVVDEKTKQFMVVNTCPGAGICKEYCYATRGGYVQYAASAESQARVLNYWYNDPEGFKNQVINELRRIVKPDVKAYLRWHDSGDFFVDAYLNLAFEVAKAVPNATLYAYTKISKVAQNRGIPENFLINFSDGAKPEETKAINYKKTKHSIVVPGSLFKDEKTTGIGLDRLKARDAEAQQRMKQVIADQYDVDVKSVVTYDEMMNTKEGNQLKWNVIVVPGLDGDLGAARRDVLGSYLLYH